MDLIVKNDSLLLEYLYENIKDKSKNNIKTLLKNGVFVNDKITTKFDYKIKKGDKITIVLKKIDYDNKIDVIYEDDDLIAVNKPCGLLTVATTKEKERTLYHLVLEYLRKKKQKVFVVHRLDRETSGIVLFAKKENVKNFLQDNWNDLVYTRKYVTVINGILKVNSGTFKSYLSENKNLVVYSTDFKHGKEAITKYKKIKSNNKYTLVDIEILTGRKNQIRVQFADNNYPIVGDKKYGIKDKNFNRLYLHAVELSFKHPINNKIINLKTIIPEEFDKLVGKGK